MTDREEKGERHIEDEGKKRGDGGEWKENKRKG